MKESFNSSQAITYELENGKVTKIARSRASDTHLPVSMLPSFTFVSYACLTS